MARKCEICGKTSKSGYSRSHSNIATKRTQKINMQSLVKNGQRKKACVACIRTYSKAKK